MSEELCDRESSIEVIFHGNNNENGDSSKEKLLDNKAMVAPLPSAGDATQHSVRINVADPEKKTSTQTQPSRCRFSRRIRLPYAINAVLCVLVTSLIILLELGYIPGTKTGFYCRDPSLSYKFTGETVNSTTLLVGNLIVIPLLVLFICEYLRKGSASRICLRELWYFYKECLIGCALVLLITEIAKAIIGEHRPHFFDVCQPDTAQNCTDGQYVTTYECSVSKYSNHFMNDTSRSFPSGHSSLSTFVAFYCSFLIQTRLPTLRTGRIFKPFLISCCLTWTLICSLTRITDNRHHWWDVGVGMLLGALGALYSLSIIHRQLKQASIPKVAMSTTTLLDVKNKDAKSEII